MRWPKPNNLGASDMKVSRGAPLHNTVTDDAAYFAARWLISAWTWTKGSGGSFGMWPRRNIGRVHNPGSRPEVGVKILDHGSRG